MWWARVVSTDPKLLRVHGARSHANVRKVEVSEGTREMVYSTLPLWT